ncbi:MAG: L,D-transpeptidase family protein [Dehalococcoidia bacterium]|nr:L,D-transpeptidase family protein [Dehalococcoidia bacterium]
MPVPRRTPTPEPFAGTEALVVTATTSHASPSTASRAVRDLAPGSRVSLVDEVRGENWIIGDQDWVPLSHDWETRWYQLDDGSYVYRAFVFLPDAAPLPSGGGGERYVVVSLEQQMAWAMVGTTIVREMPVTTGKPGFETPTGEFRVLGSGRILDERMTSQRAGFDDPNDRYDVQHVLYTQYFAEGGFALHLNYWQPTGVFGATETSHGCVGMLLPDAQFLWMFAQAGTRVIVRESGGPQPVAPVPAPTPLPTASPQPTAQPTAQPESGVKVFAVQGGSRGGAADLAARTTPGTGCTLSFATAGGARIEWPGLGTRTADAGGWLEWKWTVPTDAPPGPGRLTVSCPTGDAAVDFTVR